MDTLQLRQHKQRLLSKRLWLEEKIMFYRDNADDEKMRELERQLIKYDQNAYALERKERENVTFN